jgi:hypothetical protein
MKITATKRTDWAHGSIKFLEFRCERGLLYRATFNGEGKVVGVDRMHEDRHLDGQGSFSRIQHRYQSISLNSERGQRLEFAAQDYVAVMNARKARADEAIANLCGTFTVPGYGFITVKKGDA